ncbi:MAG: 23S rRNA (guanosine(2251)-2'-O)-methyltransferase RlmB [Ruminiclostridium sp.]|nr:23S rRNA (guanosine(2251)-2'-O)-methyltransferase RlmB [Ruminiclostridium sp.]
MSTDFRKNRKNKDHRENQENRDNKDSSEEQQVETRIIYGKNTVTEALLSHSEIDTVYILRNAGGMGKIIALAKEAGTVIKEVGEEKLTALLGAGTKHGGVAAVTAAVSYADIEDILKVSEEKGLPPFIIAADGIQDPHNLGAIIRTAEAAGADGVIITKRRSASLTSTAFKTSAGAASWIKVARVNSLASTLEDLKKKNIWIYGAEADGTPFYQAKLEGGCCLVIGSEGYGLSRLVREKCDQVLSIDMYGHVNSLNASVSAGILIYEAVRYRRGK